MKTLFHLGSCDTCRKIIAVLQASPAFVDIKLQDIKLEPMSKEQLDSMRSLSGSYESLFSRRAMKYKAMGLADKSLTEKDYQKLILEEYTFLKRPVLVVNDQIAIGNSKKSIAEMLHILEGL